MSGPEEESRVPPLRTKVPVLERGDGIEAAEEPLARSELELIAEGRAASVGRADSDDI